MSSITSCIVNEWTYEFAGLKETDRRVITRDMHELVKHVQKIKTLANVTIQRSGEHSKNFNITKNILVSYFV